MVATRKRVLAGAVLALLTAVVFAPTWQHAFIHYDDRALIVENANLDAGLSREGLAWAFTATRDGNWIPLTWTSFLLDQDLFGRDPAGTHAVNVVLHSVAAGVLLVALAALTGCLWPSTFVAAVFALHPLHVESVAWAAERKDVLSALFFALVLLLYARHAKQPSSRRLGAVGAAFACGLLAKPMLVTLPFLLLLLDYWPLRRGRGPRSAARLLLEKVPLFMLAAGVSTVTFLAQRGEGMVRSFETLPLPDRLGNALVTCFAYLGGALWPSGLAIFYPLPTAGLPGWQLAGAAVGFVAICTLVIWQRAARPFLMVGWLWYIGMLIPVIGIVQVGEQRMADRYTYLPLIGATLAVSFALAEASRRRGPWRRATVAVLAVAAVLGMMWGTRAQLRYWRDGRSLFAHALAVNEVNPTAHNGLAVALLDLERNSEAVEHLERALELRPNLLDAHVNLGIAFLRLGEPSRALPHLKRGLASVQRHRVPTVRTALGWVQLRLGAVDDAARHFRVALEADPRRGDAHLGLARALLSGGRVAEATDHLTRAEALGVTWPELYETEARLHQLEGRSGAAIAAYRRAIAARPESAELVNNLAWLLATEPELGDPAEALALVESIPRERRLGSPAILDTLAACYAAAGRREEALAVGRRALELARTENKVRLARQIQSHLERIEGGRPLF